MDRDIDRRELAEMAAVAFRGDESADIPEKIWTTFALDTLYVRATWGDGLSAKRTGQLEELAMLVQHAYRVPVVAVAYSRDLDWSEVDALAQALAEVR